MVSFFRHQNAGLALEIKPVYTEGIASTKNTTYRFFENVTNALVKFAYTSNKAFRLNTGLGIKAENIMIPS